MKMNACNVRMNWDKYQDALGSCRPFKLEGRIVKVAGIVAEADGPGLSIGSLCSIKNSNGQNIPAEVIGFNDQRVIVMPLGEMRGIAPGSRVVDISKKPTVGVGDAYLGRVVDGLGRPIDNKGMIRATQEYPIYGDVQNQERARELPSWPVRGSAKVY